MNKLNAVYELINKLDAVYELKNKLKDSIENMEYEKGMQRMQVSV